jgi:hypothetical protein
MALALSIIVVPDILLLAMLLLPLVMLILPFSCVFYCTRDNFQLIDDACDKWRSQQRESL